MAGIRRYTELDRKAALLHLALTLDADGRPLYTEAQQALGIPSSTLCNWWTAEQTGKTALLNLDEVQEERRKRWDRIKTRMAAGIEDKVLKLLDTIVPDDPNDPQGSRCRNLTTSMGIMVDKLLLLRGEAVLRSESRNLNRTIHENTVHHEIIRVPEKTMAVFEVIDGLIGDPDYHENGKEVSGTGT
jgi:hypothetical protein